MVVKEPQYDFKTLPAIIGSLLRCGRYVTSWQGMDFDMVLDEVSPVANTMGRTLPCGKNGEKMESLTSSLDLPRRTPIAVEQAWP